MFKKGIINLFYVPLFFTTSLLAQQEEGGVFIDGVAAVVGDHIILKSDIAQLVNMAAVQQRLNPVSDLDKLLILQKEFVSSAVDQKIMLEMAAVDSIEVEDGDVDRALDQQLNAFVAQAGGEEDAEKMLGQSLKSFRREFWAEMKDRIITEKYQQTLIDKINVSRYDVERFYETFKDSLPAFPTLMKLRHLLIKIQPGEQNRQEAIQALSDIKTRVENGESFEELASLCSQDPGSRQNGGSLGYVRRGALVPEFESVAFSQEIGTISDVVETGFGYHIIETKEKLGDKIKVRHILIIPKITNEDESRTFQFALLLKDSAKTLESFKNLVGKYSADQTTKETGGDLGWVDPKNPPIPEISRIINFLNVGECSSPVKTEHGYHLFWMESFRPGGRPTLNTHWSELENMALNQKRVLWFKDWIELSRKRFYIKTNNW